jgi:hypothetical protein
MKTLSFILNVTSPLSLTAIPERREIINSFDHSGSMVGVYRIPGEDNIALKDRVLDASVNPPGPTHLGVMNAITRNFGFLKKDIFSIDLKKDAYESSLATSPRVDIKANKVILYKDWREESSTIDKEIYTYAKDSEGYYLQDLIDAINSSECFSVTVLDDYRDNAFSSCLINKSSIVLVKSNSILMTKRNILSYQNIIKDSLCFTQKNTFITEVQGEPVAKGEYSVDYNKGTILSYDLPEDSESCSYYANIFPMRIQFSPIQVYSLSDDNFVSELFEKETLDSGEEINSILNEEGTDIYHTLYKQSKSFWGE